MTKWDETFWVETDASSKAVGAVLSQQGSSGDRRALEFYSAGLSPAQEKYAAGELETWGIVAAIRKWRTYLRAARKIVIITDHNPLTWLRRQKDPRNKFARWLLELESYDYQIEYRRGVDNGAADFLSRIPAQRDEEIEDEEEHFERFVYLLEDEITPLQDRFATEQRKEPTIRRAIEQLCDPKIGRVLAGPYKSQEGMRLDGEGRLCRKRALVVPRALQKEITGIAHRWAHAGVQRSLTYIRERFFWFRMKSTIEDYCRACAICAENKRRTRKKEPLIPMQLDAHEPRCAISMDIATLPWSSGGYRYVLIIVDLFSKFIEAVPMYDQSAEAVKESLLQGWIHRHGIPQVLLSDQGRNVDGRVIRELCSQYGIDKRHSSPYHPAGDGEAERAIQSMKQGLRCQLAEQREIKTEWPTLLQQATFAHNSLQNASTKYSPHELMYGTRLRSWVDVAAEPKSKDSGEDQGLDRAEYIPDSPDDTWAQARSNTEQAKELYKYFHDRRTATTPTVVQRGERVYLRNCTRDDGLDPLYQGPYRVIDFRHPNVKIESGGRKASWVHVDNCKIVPREVTDHFVVGDSAPRGSEIGDLPNVIETGTGEEATERYEIENEHARRRSTRSKRRPKRYEYD